MTITIYVNLTRKIHDSSEKKKQNVYGHFILCYAIFVYTVSKVSFWFFMWVGEKKIPRNENISVLFILIKFDSNKSDGRFKLQICV